QPGLWLTGCSTSRVRVSRVSCGASGIYDFQVSEVMSGSDLQTEAAVSIVLLGIRGSVRVARLLRFMFLGSLGTLGSRFLDNSSHSRNSPRAGVRGRKAPARGAGSSAPRKIGRASCREEVGDA